MHPWCSTISIKTPFTEPKRKMKLFKVRFFVLEKITLLMGLPCDNNENWTRKWMTIWPWRGRKVLSVAHVLSWITVSIEKKLNKLILIKCTEELGDSSPVRKRLQLRVAFQQTNYVILYTWHAKPLLLSMVRDHDSKFIWGQWASPVIAGLARFTSYNCRCVYVRGGLTRRLTRRLTRLPGSWLGKSLPARLLI